MRAGQHDGVAIGITQPAFPVRVLTSMPRFDHVSLQLPGTANCRIEVVEFKPEENTISIRAKIGIPERTVVMLDMPVVQLKDQSSVRNQSFIVRPAVPALATQEMLVTATARLDVMHTNQGL